MNAVGHYDGIGSLKIDPASTKPVKVDPEKQKITVEEAQEAAKIAGLSVIRIKKLEACAKIGAFIEQIGAKKIGRSTIVIAQEAIEESILQCDTAIRQLDGNDDPGPIIEIIRLKTALTAQLLHAANSMIRSEEIVVPENNQPSLRIPFPTGSRVAVVGPDTKVVENPTPTPTVE